MESTDNYEMSEHTINIENLDNVQVDTKNMSYAKLNSTQWSNIEKKYDDYGISVCKAMINLGTSFGQNNIFKITTSLKICGENAYLKLIRPHLKEMGLVDSFIKKDNKKDKKSSKTIVSNTTNTENNDVQKTMPKKEKKMSKKEIIIYENSCKIVDESVKLLLNSFNFETLNLDYGLRCSKILEIRCSTLFYITKCILDSIIVFDDKQEFVYKTIHTIKFVVKKLMGTKFEYFFDKAKDDFISSTFLNDLIECSNILEKYVEYNSENIFKSYPWLIDSNNYFNIIPDLSIKPYADQIEMVKCVHENEELLCFYNSNFGAGKTTSVGAICAMQMCLKSTPVLYCCAVETVRHQVGRLAYNCTIPFAVAAMHEDKLRIINHFSCKTIKDRRLVIADPVTTYEILKSNNNDYILFLDEPTVDADLDNNQMTIMIAKIFFICPPKTILVSATLPQIKDMDCYVDLFKKKYITSKIILVQSNEVKIGCEVINTLGKTIMPHNFVKSKNDLMVIIDKIKNNQFLGRLYTGQILYHLANKLSTFNIKNIEINQIFSDIDNFNYNKVRDIAIEILQNLDDCDDAIIQKFCEDPIMSPITLKNANLDTTDAHHFIGMTLIVSNNPVETAKKYFSNFIKDLPSATSLIKNYKAMVNIVNDKLKKIEGDKYDNKKEKLMETCDAKENISAIIQFPKHKQINTINHIKKYSPDANINKKFIRKSLVLEQLPLDCNVPDFVLQMLFCGIGIYRGYLFDDVEKFDPEYYQCVIELASHGLLAYLISDSSISYGTNYPISNLIIENSIQNRSIDSILQMMGRAGRIGVSFKAHVYVDTFVQNQLEEYIQKSHETISIEAINMTNALNNIIETQSITKTLPLPKISEKKKKKEGFTFVKNSSDDKSKITFNSDSKSKFLSELQPKPEPKPLVDDKPAKWVGRTSHSRDLPKDEPYRSPFDTMTSSPFGTAMQKTSSTSSSSTTNQSPFNNNTYKSRGNSFYDSSSNIFGSSFNRSNK